MKQPSWSIPSDLYAAMNGNKASALSILERVRKKVDSSAPLDEADRKYLAWLLEILSEKGAGLFPDNTQDSPDMSLVERQMGLLNLVSSKKKASEQEGQKLTDTEALQAATEEILALGLSIGDYLPKFLRKARHRWLLAVT